jgi:hypothetical protein
MLPDASPDRVLALLLEVEQALTESLDETQVLIAKVRLTRTHLWRILRIAAAAAAAGKGCAQPKGDS